MYIEIRSQSHEMIFEASSDTQPSEKEIIDAVKKEGFVAYGTDIWFDTLEGFWRAGGYIRRITAAST
jgi:hypothetical protein